MNGRPDVRTVILGDLQVAIFDFAKAGDVFPVHTHADERNNHISIVARGEIVCQGAPGIEGRVLKPGEVVDWPLAQAHGFTAVVANTRLVNIQKRFNPARQAP